VDHHLFQLPLAAGRLHHLLVNGVGCHKTVHHHRFGLADPMTPILCLQISLGILWNRRKQDT